MKFRGKETNGWIVIDAFDKEDLESKLNLLMCEHEFLDCQYSITEVQGANVRYTQYSALVLLGEKNES